MCVGLFSFGYNFWDYHWKCYYIKFSVSAMLISLSEKFYKISPAYTFYGVCLFNKFSSLSTNNNQNNNSIGNHWVSVCYILHQAFYICVIYSCRILQQSYKIDIIILILHIKKWKLRAITSLFQGLKASGGRAIIENRFVYSQSHVLNNYIALTIFMYFNLYSLQFILKGSWHGDKTGEIKTEVF